MKRINVTKTFLPPIEAYQRYVEEIWQRDQLTNQGPLLLELEENLRSRLHVEYFHFVANGTLALQLSLEALGIRDGEIITTPFSYVATASAILWQRCEPVFVDINPADFCIDPEKIEVAITDKTKAILPVHVFGRPCEVEKIEAIAKKHSLPVIYDGAHAFGVSYKGKSLSSWGDITTYSFHATKLFHTIEGGGIALHDKKTSQRVELIKRFGHNDDDHEMLGINAKASEFQAAMGLSNLEHVDKVIKARKKISEQYDRLLGDSVYHPSVKEDTKYNYAYYPVVFSSKENLEKTMTKLNDEEIFPRRYFYPSLNTLSYLNKVADCPYSEDIASRIMCLPLYPGLEEKIIEKTAQIIVELAK